MRAAFLIVFASLVLPSVHVAGAADHLVDVSGTGRAWIAFRYTGPYALSYHMEPLGANDHFAMALQVESEDGNFQLYAGYDAEENWYGQVNVRVGGSDVIDTRTNASEGRGWGGFDSYTVDDGCSAPWCPATFRAVAIIDTDPGTPWRFTLDTNGILLGLNRGTHAINADQKQLAQATRVDVGSGGNAWHIDPMIDQHFHADHAVIGAFGAEFLSATVERATTPAGDTNCPCLLGDVLHPAQPGDYAFRAIDVGDSPAQVHLLVADVEFP